MIEALAFFLVVFSLIAIAIAFDLFRDEIVQAWDAYNYKGKHRDIPWVWCK